MAVPVAEGVLHKLPLSQKVVDLIFLQAADIFVHQPTDDPRLLFELKPGSSWVFKSQEIPPRTVKINSLGLRDDERILKKGQGVFRIIIFGSSTTYGASVSQAETYTTYLERILNEDGKPGRRFEVWNAGVNAYNPNQMTRQAQKLIERGADPDLVLFQIHLLGPRAFLIGHVDVRAFEKDPTLFGEHFIMPFSLSDRFGAFLASKSRLGLLVIAHYNRMLGTHRRREMLAPKQEQNNRMAFTRFAENYRDRFRMAVINLPCKRIDDNHGVKKMADPAGVPALCVKMESGDKQLFELHPTKEVYQVWARELYETLTENGYFR